MDRFIHLFLFLFFAAAVARADEWPQWRGPARTGHASADARIPQELPSKLQVLWKIKIGEGFASPVVAEGDLVYADNQIGKETVHLIDASDAKERWRAAIDEVFHDFQGPPGPRCTPLIDDDRVYAQSCKGELQCLERKSGKVVWRVNFGKDFGAVFIGEKGNTPGAARHGNNASPLIDGDHLIAAVGGTNGASAVCFDKRSGAVVWKSQNDQAGYAAPMVGTLAGVRQVIFFTVDGVIGLRCDNGELLWRIPVKTAYARHATTPVLMGDWIVVSSHQAGLLGIKVARKEGKVEATLKWESKEAAMNFSSPVAVGSALFGLGPARDLVCVDIPTGKLNWSHPGYFSTSADRSHAAFLVLGTNILTLTDGGEAVLFSADDSRFQEAGRLQLCGMTWCNPAYAQGRLYLRDGLKGPGELLCVSLMP